MCSLAARGSEMLFSSSDLRQGCCSATARHHSAVSQAAACDRAAPRVSHPQELLASLPRLPLYTHKHSCTHAHSVQRLFMFGGPCGGSRAAPSVCNMRTSMESLQAKPWAGSTAPICPRRDGHSACPLVIVIGCNDTPRSVPAAQLFCSRSFL